MPETELPSRTSRSWGKQVFQIAGCAFCFLVGLAMIANTQMGGEGVWFWYANSFAHGVRLYADLHTPLQPLYVLENYLWIRAFGIRILATESLSVVHLLLLIAGLLLLVRECSWKDWQRAVLLVFGFLLTIYYHAYRFDDYHVLTEFLILFTTLALFRIYRQSETRTTLLLASVAAVFSGLTITTRVTDGLALTIVVAFCLLFIARSARVLASVLYLVVTAITVLAVVHATGDTFSIYVQSTVLHAAASKGGSGTILSAPFRSLLNVPVYFHLYARLASICLALCAAVTFLMRRYAPSYRRWLPLAFAAVTLMFYLALRPNRRDMMLQGALINAVIVYSVLVMYAVGVVVLVRLALKKNLRTSEGQPRILYLIPVALWMSYEVGSSGQILSSFYLPVAMLIILLAAFETEFWNHAWLKTAFLSLLLLLSASITVDVFLIPYSWQNYSSARMFTGRQWFHHPVYGWLYLDKEELAFSQRVCNDIHATPGHEPQLLSLPYPYPNYFCATPPWHDYVQTFFDTSTRATIEGLERQLQTQPPEWIVYQRQLLILKGAEHWYNNDKPIAQHDLDTLIFSKIQSHQWTLVDHSDYLGQEGGGWFIIHTKPSSSAQAQPIPLQDWDQAPPLVSSSVLSD